uniref:NR LBD domain-containing protein n=1 Tax=Steinernema glaseri TaxID=37863 RepID=A0A1I7Z3S2_9BILA
MQVGDYTKFIMQNGGYVSTTDRSNDGWEDEEEITGATKRAIYWPLLHRVLNEILNPIVQMGLSYEEIVALKAFVCYRGTMGDIHRNGHGFIKDRLNQLNCALAQYYHEHNLPGDRTGQVILLSSSVLEVSHDFVLGHHQVDFFKLWGLDSLLVQMLHHYGKH